MQFSHLNLSLLFLLLSKSCIAEDSNWGGNSKVDASEEAISHPDGSIASSIPGGDQLSLGTPALVAETAPLIASDATCSVPTENSQRRKKKFRRGGLPNDACVAPTEASPATETKLKPGSGNVRTKPNPRVPGNQTPPHAGPLFESGSWSAPLTLRTGDQRCPDPIYKLPVCAFDKDIAFIGIPLDLGVVYPRAWPFYFDLHICTLPG